MPLLHEMGMMPRPELLTKRVRFRRPLSNFSILSKFHARQSTFMFYIFNYQRFFNKFQICTKIQSANMTTTFYDSHDCTILVVGRTLVLHVTTLYSVLIKM